MTIRETGLCDRLIAEIDVALRTVGAPARTGVSNPADSAPPDDALAPEKRKLSARLMRVNHAGEVAAQALYRGQSLVSRDDQLRGELLDAAIEEHAHLAWCEQRIRELDSHVSYLTPVWYGGSFLIGMAAGLIGDRGSLGFIAETEKQVAEHLESHLNRLPENDVRSRRIVEQMRDDEIRHGTSAMARGGEELPDSVKSTMHWMSRVMTELAYRL
jgi:ubiquinone biosynthesis monooxygenase Coq7